MKMRWLAVVGIILFGGCSGHGPYDLFKIDKQHERSIEQLRSGSILLSLETKAIISSLYLNKINPDKYRDGEYFIVSLYIEKENRISKDDYEANGFRLSLNGKKALSSQLLEENDPYKAYMPFQNGWNQYYLVRFDSLHENAMALKLEKDQIGSVVLNYQK